MHLTQSDQSLLENVETLHGSASTISKFVGDQIKGNFVSDYVLNLSQQTLSPLEIKVLEKVLGFSSTPSSINESSKRRAFTTRNLFRPDRERYFVNASRKDS